MEVGKASEVQGVPVTSVQGVPEPSWSRDLVVPDRDLGTESGEGDVVTGDLLVMASQTKVTRIRQIRENYMWDKMLQCYFVSNNVKF